MATLLESEKRNLDRKASEKNLQSTGTPGPARGTVQFGAARAMEMAARISGRRTLRAPTPSPLVREGTRSGDELWRRCRELTAVSDKGLRALRSVNVEKWFLAFWFSPDDRHFAAGAKEIYMYDLGNGEKKLAAKRTSMVYACACSPCATLFCVGDEEGHLLVYTLLSDPSVEVSFPWIKRKEGEPPPVLWETRLDSSVTDAAFSTDGKWIATITRSGAVRVFNAVDCVEGTGGSPPRPRKRPHPLNHGGRPFIANGGHESVSTIAFSENVLAVAGGASGKDADTAGDSFRVGLWRMPDLEELDSIELGINAVTPVASVAFRPDGLQLAVGTQSGTIRVYNIQPDGSADHDGARETRVHKSPPLFWRHNDEGSVNALCFSNTAGCIHSVIDNAQDENGVYANEKCSCCSKRHKPRWLLAAGLGSGTFQVYDAATTARKASFKLDRSGGTVCQFSPDDMQLAVGGGAAQHVVLHELRPLEPVGRFAVNMERRPRRPSWDQKPEKISGACVSKDYVALASGSVIEIRDRSTRDNDRVCRINVMIDKARLPPRGGESPARPTSSRHREEDDIAAANAPIALRPSGEYVAVVVAKKTVCIYELPSGEKVMELPGYTGEVTGVKWSPNGKVVISWGSFGVRVNVAPDHDDVHLHSDQSPGATVLEFSDKGGVATNCVINNRGNLIASCGYSDTVVVRKVADGSKIFTFHQGGDQPAGSTGGVCFSDDGKRLAYHVDKTVLVRSMEDDKGGKAGRVVMKFDDIDAVPVPMGAFSPGRGDMLLCLEGVLGPDKPDDTHQIFVLDVSSGEVRPGPIHRNSNTPEDPPRLSWDSTLRPCLPTGEILSHCIGWLPTIPAYTFESCTCHVGGLGPQHDPDALAHVFSQFGRVVQATVRTRKGVNQNWALITLGDHEAVTAACEASGKPMVHHFKVSHVGKDKAEASTGSFAQIWKESRQKAAEADAARSHHADQADDAGDDAPRQEGDEADVFGNTQGTPTPLLLWAATDDEMVVMDIRQFGFAAEDGAISQKQLVTLTNWDERAVADVAGRLPHSVNIRDPASGDTVLHDVVRRGNFDALDAWLAGGAVFTPIANYCAHTALDEAITQHSRTAVTHLVQNIIETLNDVTSPLVTASLKRLAQEMPELSLEVLQSLERRSATNEDDFSSADGAVVQTNRKLHEKFHAGREPSGALVVGAESRQFTAGQWNAVLPSPNRAATDMEVASKVVAMANFIGPPDESPFWDLVENGIIDAGVFDSKLLQLAVQYKWQNVHPIARREFIIYLCHFIIMCLTLIVDTQGHVDSIYCRDGDGSTDPADPNDPAGKVTACWVNSFAGKPHTCWMSSEFAMNALYAILLLSNTRMLLSECKEIVAEIHEAKSCIKGLRAFMNDFWNYFDCGSVIFVYLAAWAHYAGDPCSVEQLGAVAIILNSVSVIQLMRPFTQTGALIQTVINIVIDIRGFWYICLVVLFGFTCALTVCQPRTAAFTLRDGVDNNSIGVAYPLLTMFSSMVGAFELDEYTNAQSTVLLVLFLLFIVIIMLNLLITIIGESYGNIKQKEQVTMLRLRAEVIVEEEKKHEAWKTDTNHVVGRRVWYNRETGDTRSTQPAGIDPSWADIGQAECDMGHDGMPKGSPWLLRQERGSCRCKHCIYPRYLHFCEPAEAADSMEQLNAFQIEKDFRASVRRDLKKMDKHIAKLQDDIMDKMGAIESLLKDRH